MEVRAPPSPGVCNKPPLLLTGSAYNMLDLHSKNISFTLPHLDSWPIEKIHESFGEPITNTVSRLDDQPLGPEVPSYTVESAYFWSPDQDALEKQIMIIDFGEASFSTEERKKLHTLMPLRAPESFFGEEIGLPVDIWALACTIYDIFGKRSPFDTFMPDRDSVVLEMVSTLGMLPDRWWGKWENRSRYFLSDHTPNTDIIMNYTEEAKPLAVRIEQTRFGRGEQSKETLEKLNTQDLAGLRKLLASMLRYEPSERATAEECVKLEWVQQLLREEVRPRLKNLLHHPNEPED